MQCGCVAAFVTAQKRMEKNRCKNNNDREKGAYATDKQTSKVNSRKIKTCHL